MSKLVELIREMCPNGVEYKELREIATITRGGNLQKKDFTDEGVPCIHYGQIYTRYGLFADSAFTYISEVTAKKQKMADTNDIVMAVTSENIEDVCKCVVWLGENPVAVSGHTAIIKHNQNAKFLAYYFHSSMFFAQKRKLAHGTKVIEVTPDTLNSVIVPVPPMEVQREIVQILDKFTLLSAELSAELSARRKQYAYYVDKMFSDENVEIRTLDEVAEIIDSLHATPKYTENGYSMIRVADIKGGYVDTKNALKVDDQTYIEFIKRYKPQFNDIIVSRVGSFGNFSLVPDEDICLGQNVALIHPKINNKYLYYYLNSFYVKDYIEQKAHGGGYKNIGIKDLMKIPVKLHTEEEQEKIARILEKFDVINSNMDEGIPAEIEARRKQYEYYRDKLLSFKKR